MSFFDVNVEDDPYYQKGVERGEERGVKKNFTIVVQKMLAKGLTPEWIASTLDVSLEEVLQIQQSLQKGH
ncbi:MAG: hypothetical protein AAFV95_00765 [Bacteroidota bacterium]